MAYALPASAQEAHPGEHPAEEAHPGEHPAGSHEHEHEEHHKVEFSAAGVALFALGERTEALPGFGVSVVIPIIPHQLEVEGVFHALFPEGAIEFPIDLLVRKPFHVAPWFEPYVGLGGTVVPFKGEEESGVRFGVATAAGADFWVHRNVGFFAEFNYNLLFPPEEGLRHEVGGVAGVLFGF